MTKTIDLKITSEQEGINTIIKTSKSYPTKIITAYGRFGKLTIYVNDKQPQTDDPASIQTYKQNGGFFKNGEIVSPTKTWMKKHLHIPTRTGG